MSRANAAAGPPHYLDTMGWHTSENWTADQFAQARYQAIKTPRSGDAGQILSYALYRVCSRSALQGQGPKY